MAELGSPEVHSPIRGQPEQDAAAEDQGTEREPRGDIGLRARGVVRTAQAGLADEQQPHDPEADESAGGAEIARPSADQPRPDDEPGDQRDRREEEGQPEQGAQHKTREEQHPWSHHFPRPAADDSASVRPGPGAVKAVAAPHDRQMVATTGGYQPR